MMKESRDYQKAFNEGKPLPSGKPDKDTQCKQWWKINTISLDNPGSHLAWEDKFLNPKPVEQVVEIVKPPTPPPQPAPSGRFIQQAVTETEEESSEETPKKPSENTSQQPKYKAVEVEESEYEYFSETDSEEDEDLTPEQIAAKQRRKSLRRKSTRK